ncbi:MAG TPA: Fic family protein [Candidatus Pacearchaeota archaeon]|nr:Fic family protein [Candidatus Pacearchaeota archaeon]
MNYLTAEVKNRINEKLKLLNSYRPLRESVVKKIREQFELEMTYNSNAMEGNSLTLKETFLVINEGITIKGKPLKDHLEAKNHKEALDYLYELMNKGNNTIITETLIRSLNYIVVQNTDKIFAGKYRDGNVIIAGADHKPPKAIDVPKLMNELILSIRKNKKKLHPVELAAIAHHKLVFIHPFFDGNGRTARLIQNIITMQEGYPLTIILKNDRKKYYNTLSQADKGDFIPFLNFIAKAVERSLDIYLDVLIPSKLKKEKFISLRELSETSSFSPKYLNLLARNGRLEAHKEGRDWVSSKEALERYLENRTRKRESKSN